MYHLTTWRGLIDHIVDPSGLKYVSWEDRCVHDSRCDELQTKLLSAPDCKRTRRWT